MTDRELLELAAKAAVIKDLIADVFGFYRVIGEHEDGTKCMVVWNPLTDDGDALRMAVQCGLEIYFEDTSTDGSDSYVTVGYSTDSDPVVRYCVEQGGKDIFKATRRAIVRAAAEIGKAMK